MGLGNINRIALVTITENLIVILLLLLLLPNWGLEGGMLALIIPKFFISVIFLEYFKVKGLRELGANQSLVLKVAAKTKR